jgi:NAD(P)-dependent dehydrogenase (short-subunit alcohol dehydrogenase family)
MNTLAREPRNANLLPNITRSDAGAIVVSEWIVSTPERQQAFAEAFAASWQGAPYPYGLLSASLFASTDGKEVLLYGQWSSEEAYDKFDRTQTGLRAAQINAAVPGLERRPPVKYRLYRSTPARGSRQSPGCIVAVNVEFDGADENRQRQWVDSVLEALDAESELPRGGIAGHFHVSTDGTRVLNYAEWTDEQAHIAALEKNGGSIGSGPKWQRVRTLPGMKASRVNRYQLRWSIEPPPPPSTLSGLRVAITGGTSGLGLALVGEMVGRGAQVAFVARHREGVERVLHRYPGTNGIVGDMSRKDEIHPIAMQVVGLLGGLDVLINNASDLGPAPLALLADTDCEDLERALATNVLGPFRLTKALLGALAATAREGRGGVVLNVSSDAAVNPYPRWGAYGASKAALHHMSRIWNEELVAAGIAILSLDPGDMDTPMHAMAVPEADPSELKRPETAAREFADAIAKLLTFMGVERTPHEAIA